MSYNSPPLGQEISCVMKEIPKNYLFKNKKLKSLIENSLKKNNFTILKSIYHNFSPQGFTALILLSESHLAVHTYPEYNSISFNMYSCRGKNDAEPIFNLIKKELKPKEILFYKKNKIPVN